MTRREKLLQALDDARVELRLCEIKIAELEKELASTPDADEVRDKLASWSGVRVRS